MKDMVEYVTDLTHQMTALRRQQKEAEAHIGRYRSSAEKSVEAMLEELYGLRRQQENYDQ